MSGIILRLMNICPEYCKTLLDRHQTMSYKFTLVPLSLSCLCLPCLRAARIFRDNNSGLSLPAVVSRQKDGRARRDVDQ